MIKLSKTYEVVTEESAMQGDAAEHGFEWKDVEHGFRELVDILTDDGYIYASDSHGVPRWVSTEPEMDMYTGEYTSYSLHPGDDRMSQKYWAKAWMAVKNSYQ